MDDICVYGAGGQLEPGFIPALMRSSAAMTATDLSPDAALGETHWGLLRAALGSNMLSALRAGKVEGPNDFVMDNGVMGLRTVYIQDRNGDVAITNNSCPPAADCKNPFSEFFTPVCKYLQTSFCIDDKTIRRFSKSERDMITVAIPETGSFTIPRVLVDTFQAEATGFVRKLNREVWLESISAIGVNAINGSSAVYPFNVTSSFFGNPPIDSGGQEFQKLQFSNAMGRMHVVGFGNLFNYVSSLNAARFGEIDSVNYFGTSQRKLIDGRFVYYADPLADTIMGPNQAFLFDEGKYQFIFQNMKGSPDWKNGKFPADPNASLTTWTPTSETVMIGERLYFLMPVYALPGLFLDMEMKREECVNGEAMNNGWKVTMMLKWGIYRLPTSFYSATGALAGTTKVIAIQANAA